MKKAVLCSIIAVIFLIAGVQAVYADGEDYGFEIDDITDTVGEDASEYLPESFDKGSILQAGLDMFASGVQEFLKSFASNVLMISGIVMLAAIVSKIGESLSFKYASDIVSLAQILPIALISFNVIDSLFKMISAYVEQINSLMTSYGLIMTEVYLLGGNVSTAAVSSAWLAFALDISRKICIGALIPLLKISFAVTLASSVSQSVNLRAIADFIRNIYVTSSVFFMTVITVIMGFQSTVAASEDSVALRSMRFAASNSVPVIGSLLSESMRTLTSGIAYTKSYSGLICIVCLIAVSFAPLVQVFAAKYTFSLSASFAKFLSVPIAVDILDNCGKLMNYMIGIVVITDVYFIYFITVFIKSATAIG